MYSYGREEQKELAGTMPRAGSVGIGRCRGGCRLDGRECAAGGEDRCGVGCVAVVKARSTDCHNVRRLHGQQQAPY